MHVTGGGGGRDAAAAVGDGVGDYVATTIDDWTVVAVESVGERLLQRRMHQRRPAVRWESRWSRGFARVPTHTHIDR